jgi:choline monooxygenase
VRLETWDDFLFVTFDAGAPSLAEWLGDLPERLANYRLADMRLARTSVHDLECNWKVFLENAMESYHVGFVHRKHLDPTLSRVSTFTEPRGPYEILYVVGGVPAVGGFPVIESLVEEERGRTLFVWIQPTVQFIMSPTYMKFRQYLPLGPERLRLVENWCFPRSTLERADFAERVEPLYYAPYEAVITEDVGITRVIQSGLRSRLYRPGRYSPMEHNVHRVATYVVDRVTDA